MNRTLTRAHIEEGAKNRELLPLMSEFKGRPGYKEQAAKVWRTGVGFVDGYETRYSFPPNRDGKLTKQASEVGEAMAPFNRAELERQARLQHALPKVRLKGHGGFQYVDPDQADAVARRNGWRHERMPGRRCQVERGPQDMLFQRRLGSRDWAPLGVRCLGTPLRGTRKVSRRGVQFDPDGRPWRFMAGEWRMV